MFGDLLSPTERQLEILFKWGAEGVPVKRIALDYGLAIPTVYREMHKGAARLGAETPAQAVWILARCSEDEPDEGV